MSFENAAALPLTVITAWEVLFDLLSLLTSSQGTVLIVGGAGRVGSIAIQLIKKLTALKCIAKLSHSVRKWARIIASRREPR